MDNDVVYRNVFTKVNIPNIKALERRPLTEEEIRLITRSYTGHRMGIPALLLLFCGLRRGELIALTLNDIDLKTKFINVNKSVIHVNNQSEITGPKFRFWY